MSNPSFDIPLLLVFFVYGLAFFGMGLTLALESIHSPALAEGRLLRLLAAFGILHGVHEWLDSYLLQLVPLGLNIPTWLLWTRVVLLLVSFCFLFSYGCLTVHLYLKRSPRPTLLLVEIIFFIAYEISIVAFAITTYRTGTTLMVNLIDVLTRYLVAVPAALLAAIAMQVEATQMRAKSRQALGNHIYWAAIGFGIYGLSQLFVPPVDMFPARHINSTWFLSITGFPIQVIRALMATLITYSLLRATQLIEGERQEHLIATHQERVEAMERVQQELTKQEALKQQLLRHTVKTQEEERSRIARELHDETSQILTAFSLDLATLNKIICDVPEVKNLVQRLNTYSKQMSQGLYRLVHDLRPAQLDDLGLVPALEYLIDDAHHSGLTVSVVVAGKGRRLDSTVETILYRVVQEALQNIKRHAEVKKASLSLKFSANEIILIVEDTGIGFFPDQSFLPPRGWGLAGMRERVESIGGQLSIDSAPGKGTRVEVLIPVFDLIP